MDKMMYLGHETLDKSGEGVCPLCSQPRTIWGCECGYDGCLNCLAKYHPMVEDLAHTLVTMYYKVVTSITREE